MGESVTVDIADVSVCEVCLTAENFDRAGKETGLMIYDGKMNI